MCVWTFIRGNYLPQQNGKYNWEEIQAEDAIIELKEEKSRAAVKRKVDKNKRLEAAVLIDL